jgi:hypothetical protein
MGNRLFENYSPCPPPVCDDLYIHLTTLMRHLVHKIHNDESLHEVMFNERVICELLSSIRSIVRNVRPTSTVYIAMDGPLPNMALAQKREQTASEALCINQMLSGTSFIQTVQGRIQSLINLGFLPNVELLDFQEVGEAAVKIMKHVRNSKSSAVIYGMTSDLTILCTLLYTPDVVMCTQLNNELIFYKPINGLDDLFTKHGLSLDTQTRCDVMLMCIFAGNDYVRPIDCAHMHNDIWSVFASAYVRHNKVLTRPSCMAIDFASLLEFIHLLPPLTTGEPDVNVDHSIANDYLMSVKWCWDYYTHGIVSWSTVYPHQVAPRIVHLPDTWAHPPPFTGDNSSASPFAQLMHLLPSHQWHLIPGYINNNEMKSMHHDLNTSQGLCERN